MTFVVAGAGYGKTVAVQQWAKHAAQTVAWVSLDAADDTSAGLWRYLAEALVGAAGAGRTTLALMDSGVTGIEVVNELLVDLGGATGSITIVLDDVHLLRSDVVIDELSFFLERLPPAVRAILSSRVDPPLPLGRWRADDRLAEVRQHDLAFDVDEAAAMFSHHPGVGISADDLSFLTVRTEGWAAGLHLAMLSIQAAPDPHVYIHSALANDRVIADYLIGEVVDHLSELDRAIVLALSILDEFDVDLAVAVTEQNDAAVRVRSLESRSLLLLPVDQARTIFRFHHLVRELLEHELRWRAPELVPELHRRAAAHFDRIGETELAARHHFAAGDVGAAYELVAAAAYDYIDRGDFTAAGRWVRAFPTAFVGEEFERVLTLAVLSVAAGEVEHGHDLLLGLARRRQLTALTTDEQIRESAVRAWVELIRGDVEQSELAAFHCLALLDGRPPAGRDVERLPSVLVRQALHRGNVDAAARWLCESDVTRSDASALSELLGPALEARVAVMDGRPEVAERAARSTIDRAEQLHLAAVVPVIEAHLVLGTLLLQRAELSEAESHVDRAVLLAEQTRSPILQACTLLLAVDLATARFGAHGGRAVLTAARAVFDGRSLGPSVAELLDAAEARLRIADGDVRGARALLERLPASAESRLLRARVWANEGNHGAVQAVLADPDVGTVRQQIEAKVLLARSLAPADADRLVVEAAELSIRSGFALTFLREGQDLLRIGRRAVAHTESAALQELLCRAADRAVAPELRLELAPLTRRECELLALLPTHLSYREVAIDMSVSLNTVKTYQKSLFLKLGARSRSEAVAIAAAGHLVATPEADFTRSG